MSETLDNPLGDAANQFIDVMEGIAKEMAAQLVEPLVKRIDELEREVAELRRKLDDEIRTF
jgi:uncharacterized protein YceH (UPF0502 family)